MACAWQSFPIAASDQYYADFLINSPLAAYLCTVNTSSLLMVDVDLNYSQRNLFDRTTCRHLGVLNATFTQ